MEAPISRQSLQSGSQQVREMALEDRWSQLNDELRKAETAAQVACYSLQAKWSRRSDRELKRLSACVEMARHDCSSIQNELNEHHKKNMIELMLIHEKAESDLNGAIRERADALVVKKSEKWLINCKRNILELEDSERCERCNAVDKEFQCRNKIVQKFHDNTLEMGLKACDRGVVSIRDSLNDDIERLKAVINHHKDQVEECRFAVEEAIKQRDIEVELQKAKVKLARESEVSFWKMQVLQLQHEFEAVRSTKKKCSEDLAILKRDFEIDMNKQTEELKRGQEQLFLAQEKLSRDQLLTTLSENTRVERALQEKERRIREQERASCQDMHEEKINKMKTNMELTIALVHQNWRSMSELQAMESLRRGIVHGEERSLFEVIWSRETMERPLVGLKWLQIRVDETRKKETVQRNTICRSEKEARVVLKAALDQDRKEAEILLRERKRNERDPRPSRLQQIRSGYTFDASPPSMDFDTMPGPVKIPVRKKHEGDVCIAANSRPAAGGYCTRARNRLQRDVAWSKIASCDALSFPRQSNPVSQFESSMDELKRFCTSELQNILRGG